jgi:hypothetical protein
LFLPLHIILFLHLLSINHKCTQPCYFPLLLKLAAQKLKKNWSTSIWCSRRVINPSRLPVELWCRSATLLLRVFILVFCKTLFGNKCYILWYWLFCIHYPFYVRYMCKLDSWAHMLWEFGLTLKLGVTCLLHSCCCIISFVLMYSFNFILWVGIVRNLNLIQI